MTIANALAGTIVQAAADSLADTAVAAKAGAEVDTTRIVDPRLLVWLAGKKEGCEQSIHATWSW